MKDMTLLVMAAGMGSRYGGLKQLDAVGPNGETIIDFSVYDAIRAGYNKVVFIIRKDFEKQFKQKISNKYKNKIDVIIHNVGGALGVKDILSSSKEWIKVWKFNVGIAINLNNYLTYLKYNYYFKLVKKTY